MEGVPLLVINLLASRLKVAYPPTSMEGVSLLEKKSMGVFLSFCLWQEDKLHSHLLKVRRRGYRAHTSAQVPIAKGFRQFLWEAME
jgi:hypothetical protein